mgnify:FL=1
MIKENALKYLGYLDNQVDSNTEILLNECLKELEQVTPKFMYQIYTLTHHPLTIKELNLTINYPDLIDLFDSCDRIVIIACTLGLQLDQQLRYYSKINLTKMTVMDALASSYIEIKCDEYEAKQNFGKRTFRFCPGYGNVPLELNKNLANALNCSKHIGLTVQESNLLLPQKSIFCLIGLGDEKLTKHCFSCVNKENCMYRKRGQRCYKKD